MEEGDWSGLLPTALFAVLGVVLLVLLSYRPAEDARGVGMVFPFSMTEDEILSQVAAAGGRVARFGGLGHMAVVVRDDGATPQASDFGAMFTLSPFVMSACFDSTDAANRF